MLGGLFAAAALPEAQAQDLYWTTNGAAIMGAERDGSNPRVVFDGSGMAGIAIDVFVTENFIYWTDNADPSSEGGVWRADRDGGNPAPLVSNPGTSNWAPQFIAINEELSPNKIYFSCYYTGLYSADLDTGGNVVHLGKLSQTNETTGLVLRGSNELLSVTAESDSSIFTTNIADKSHDYVYHWPEGDGTRHGLDINLTTDTLYYAGMGGSLYAYTLYGATNVLKTDLALPLGVKLSGSKTHVLYVERGSGTVSAYDLASEETFTLVGSGAHFGVAIWGDPEPPPPAPPMDLPIVEDFSGGTAGEPITDQPTSDGKAVWRLENLGVNASINYGEDNGIPTFEPLSLHGQASVYLEVDSNSTENYVIRFDELLLRGFSPSAGDPVLFIGSRKTDGTFTYGYQIRPWRSGSSPTGAPRWAVWYHTGSGNTATGKDHPGNEELLLQGLELRVKGSQQRLYYGNGVPVDPFWRDTQATFNSGVEERAIVIGLDSSSNEDNWINPRFKKISIVDWTLPTDTPPTATPGWQLVDDFDGRSLGRLSDQGLWTSSVANADVIENPYGSGQVLRVAGGHVSHPFTISQGSTATVFFRVRTFGNDDISLLTGYPHATLGYNELVSAGGAAAQAASQFAFRASGELQAVDNAASPDHLKKLGEHAAHTWYDVWMVVNNSNNTARYYVKGGAYADQTLLNFEGTEDINHRNLRDEDIVSLAIHNFARAPMLVDQVWVDRGGENLTDPAPGASFTDPARDITGPLLAYEGYDYPAGDLLGQAGGSGWIYEHAVNGPTDMSPVVVESSKTWMDLNVTGNRVLASSEGINNSGQPYHSFRFIDTNRIDETLVDEWGQISSLDPIYVSVIAQGVAPTVSPFWGISIFRSNQERIFLGKGGGETVGWHFREQSVPSGTLNRVVTSLSLTDKHFLVIRLDQAAGKAYLFANPDPAAGEPAVEAAEAELLLTSTIGNWGFNNVRVVGNSNGISVDEIRVGTTWDSVTPTGAVAPSGFAAWQEEQFGSETDPAIVGPDADPDGDGTRNLVEYALGRDPLVAGTDGVPVTGTIEIEGEHYLTLTFTRPIGLDDINYDAAASDDLVGWSNTAVLVSATPDGNGAEEVVYRHPQALSTGSRGYLRLEVSLK